MMMDDDECEAISGMLGSRKPKYQEKTCPTATMHTTNPALLGPGLEPRLPQWEASD
jgi:hypothetical protein